MFKVMQSAWKHHLFILFGLLLIFAFIVYATLFSKGDSLVLNVFQSSRKSIQTHSTHPPILKIVNHSNSYYFDNFKIYADKINGSTVSFQGQEKLIVFYGQIYGLKNWLHNNFTKDGVFYSLNTGGYSCPRKCIFTHLTKYSTSADAIVFSVLDSLYRPENPVMPIKRPKNQIWLGQASEASVNHPNFKNSPLNSAFNWTVTYKMDSDIILPYGYVKKIDKKSFEGESSRTKVENNDYKTNFSSKALAVALISNCNTDSRREDLIEEMRKFVPVEMYGRCGQPCPNVMDCRQFLAQKFKFILAFENTLCEDYVTEKFFHSLQYDIVPIVYGLANYKKIGPPHSYINIMNFPSIKHLASHLQMLGKNEEEYEKYFEWKKYFKIQLDPQRYYCEMCIKLWENNFRKEYFSFYNWWTNKRPTDGPDYDENLTGLRPTFRKILKERKTECVKGSKILKELGVSKFKLRNQVPN